MFDSCVGGQGFRKTRNIHVKDFEAEGVELLRKNSVLAIICSSWQNAKYTHDRFRNILNMNDLGKDKVATGFRADDEGFYVFAWAKFHGIRLNRTILKLIEHRNSIVKVDFINLNIKQELPQPILDKGPDSIEALYDLNPGLIEQEPLPDNDPMSKPSVLKMVRFTQGSKVLNINQKIEGITTIMIKAGFTQDEIDEELMKIR